MRFVPATALALALAALPASPAAAADAGYPTKPIRLIVPFAPGGTNDVMARMIGTHLTEVLGKTVIVDNRTGAEGVIGTEIAVRSAPDGHTLVVLSAGYVMNPAVRKLPYDPVTALEFIAKLGSSATVLCVGPSIAAGSVKELLAATKSKPGQILFGASGGFQVFATVLFRNLSGQDFNIVPYKGAFPAMMDVIGGQLHAIIIPIVPSLPHLRSGRLKGLATGALKRSALLPELATLDELGLTGYEASNNYSIATPARTPQAIVRKLHSVIADYMRLPETEKRLVTMGAEVDIKTPEEMRRIIPVEIAKWEKVARSAGMPKE